MFYHVLVGSNVPLPLVGSILSVQTCGLRRLRGDLSLIMGFGLGLEKDFGAGSVNPLG